MTLFTKRLDQVTADDLQALIEAQTPEKRTLDYKAKTPGNSDADKKEFLADVSSFANAAGGHLIFGIAEQSGSVLTMPGLVDCNADQEILRLEQIVIQGVEPRIPGIDTVAVSLENGRPVIVIRIPRSWAMPHRVSFKESDKFYSRRSAGKFRLDMDELRAAFSLSDSIMQKVTSFRAERLSQIVAGLTPTRSEPGVRVVLHLVPVSAFDRSFQFDLSKLPDSVGLNLFAPVSQLGSFSHTHNYEGFISYTPNTHTQVFRSGIVEFVNFLDAPSFGQSIGQLNGSYIEHAVLKEATQHLLPIQHAMGVDMPMLIMLSLLGVEGLTVVPSAMFGKRPISRDTLIINDVMVESYDIDLPKAMKPIFDVMWNASGWSQSPGYDAQGNRIP